MPDQKSKDKLGIALIGLSAYSTEELGPALKETQHCYLAGIVTGTPGKIDQWKKEYDIADENIYNYDNFDSIKNNPEIDIIYIVLPNSMHEEYVIRAAKAGKHVLCEKPMAITVEECDRMIAACKEAGKMLSIGYRLHFEPFNQEMMRIGKEKTFGRIKKIFAGHGMKDTQEWRTEKRLAGGGPLMDLGVYCIQACRYITGLEPLSVSAQEGPKTKPDKFKTVEQSLSWQMKFPESIIANCKASYSEYIDFLKIEAENGWAQLAPAFAYKGLKGKTSSGKMKFKGVNHQAKQMDDFALAIKHNRPTPVPGEMGRKDVEILQAIYKAMETGENIFL